MSKRNSLTAAIFNFGEIIGNAKIYRVPPYQRDYSWEEENWEDLWTDILQMIQSNHSHYMGSIVLRHFDDKQYIIIDGQQRLATLSIIVISVIKLIKNLADKGIEKEQNEERIELLRKKFLGDKDASSLRYTSKLFLNEANDSFYQGYLLQSRVPSNVKRLSDSNQLLWDSYNYFLKKIGDYYKNSLTGEKLAAFIEQYIADYLVFTRITVQDDLSAYTVFETLNSRGIELTPTDLLKNYLFSLVAGSNTDLKHVKDQWKEIIDIIGLRQFPHFLRHYLNSRYPFARKEYLFKSVKNRIAKPEDVFDLLDALEEAAIIYEALDNPGDDLWDKEQRKNIRELKLFGVSLVKPLLLAAYTRYTQPEFSRLLKICVNISFRHNIIGKRNPNELETVFSKIAIDIFNAKISTAREAFQMMKAVYPSDEDFRNDFATRIISTKRSNRKKRFMKAVNTR